jgi:hypothetical protein
MEYLRREKNKTQDQLAAGDRSGAPVKKQVSRVKSPKHSTGRDGHGHVGEMMSKQECPKGERKQSNGRGAVATERNKQAEPIPQRGN